ncbi:unnamed protein product [Paramecium octaurelia]|uniref:VLIG-type G domain-containing protein n=1 Tax=Paramecium octaurelia TaxID=43137 RepID=A0A8S1SXU5_PAROT|nr:unnamed protein product [Paramecium octaurelia]
MQSQKEQEIHNIIMQQDDGIDEIIQQNSQTFGKLHNQSEIENFSKIKDGLEAFLQLVHDDILQREEEINDFLNDNILINLNNEMKKKAISYLFEVKQDHTKLDFLYNILDENCEKQQYKSRELNENQYYLDARKNKEYRKILNKLTNEKFILVNKIPTQIASSKDFLETILNTQKQKIHLLFDYNEYQQGLKQLTQIQLINLLTLFIDDTEDKLQQIIGSISIRQCTQFQSYIDWIQEQEQSQFTTQQNQKFLNELLCLDLIKIKEDLIKFLGQELRKLNNDDTNKNNDQQGVLTIFQETLKRQICCNLSLDSIYFAITFYFWIKHHNKIVNFHQEISEKFVKVEDKFKERIFQTKLKQYQKDNQEQDSIHKFLMNKIIFYKSNRQYFFKKEPKERNSDEYQIQNISNYFSRIFNQCFHMDLNINDKIDQQANFIQFLEQLQELHFYQIRFAEKNQGLKHFIQILWINTQNDTIFEILISIPNQESELIIFLQKLQSLNKRMDNTLYYLILDILDLIIIKDQPKIQNVKIFRDQFEDLQSFQCIENCVKLKSIILNNSLHNVDECIKILEDIFNDLYFNFKEVQSGKQRNCKFLLTLGGKDYGDQFLMLYHCFKNNEIQSQIINIVIKIQFFKKNRNLDIFKQCCYELFMLDKEIYDQCYEQFKDITDFQISSKFFQHKKIHEKYPNKMNILIEQFILSRTEQKKNNQIINWVFDLNNKEYFLSLLPFLFDIIKRGESIEQLLDQVNKNIGNENIEFMNFKVIFQILYNNSDKQLQMLLLKNLSFNHPIPFVYQNPNVDNILVEDDLYLINPNIYFLLQNQYSIINFSFSKSQKQIGKTELINKVFFRKDKFNIQDTNNLNRNTIDLMLDKEFNGSRNLLIADTHGYIPQSLLLKILPLFSFWIIQMDTEEELKENLENIRNINSKIKIINHKIQLIVRNSKSKQIDQPLQKELIKSNIQIQQIQNLSSKGLSNQLIQQQIKLVQIQIFQQIVNHEKFKPFNKENFIQILNNEDQEELKKFNILVQKIEDEAKNFFNNPKGFYNSKAFPQRHFDEIIKEMQEKESQLFEASQFCQTKEIKELQQKIQNCQTSQKQLKSPTELLKIFKELICSENYTSYITLISAIHDLTRESTKNLWTKHQILLDKLQVYKVENIEDKEGFKKIKQEFEECEKELQSKSLNIDIFWREYIKQSFLINQCQEVADLLVKLLMKGETFELLDGEQFQMNINFFEFVVKSFEKMSKNNKILVIGILGPQSSGKSTILNKIFGCNFFSSVGKSTKGIYFQMIEVKKNSIFENQFDFILILDTEGLQSPNQKDPLFDKRISLFIFAICDIILINVKGEINSQFKNLVEICIYSLAQIQNALSNTKQISWCFNQNIDTQNKQPFIDQLTQLTTQLFHDNGQFGKNKEQQQDILELIEIKKENIQILSTTAILETWNIEELQQIWKYLIPNESYSKDAYKYGIKVIENYIEKCKKKQQSVCGQLLENFFLNSYKMWETISKLPDLLEFSELISLQQNQLISKFYYQLWNENKLTFKSQIPTLIKQKIEQLHFDLNVKNLQEIQYELEQKLSIDCENILKMLEERLNQFKEEKNIQKNIYQKFVIKLQNEIHNLQTECTFSIIEQIQNQEIEYQKSRGFREINKYINQLSPKSRMQLQTNESLMIEQFNIIWGNIKIKYQQQRKLKYDEIQTASLKQIKSYFQEYQLTIPNDNNFQSFFHEKINKFDYNEEEKDKIFQQYSQTLMQNQFTKLPQKDIFNVNFQNLSIEQKIEKSSGSLLALEQIFKVIFNISLVSKTEIKTYFQIDFQEDLQKIDLTKTNDLLKILDLFQVEYDQVKKNSILQCSRKNNNEGYSNSCYQFIQTFNFNNLDRQFQFSEADLKLFKNYFKSKIQCRKNIIWDTQEINVLREKHIILQYECCKVESKKLPADLLNYITYPKKSKFLESFQVEFNNMLNKEGKWNFIYSEIYDKIKNSMLELPENTDIISKDIIYRVMQQVSEFTVNRYKKQFALYGVQLSNLGERCIYYYSLHIIWRFYCLRIWKDFEKNENLVDKSKNDSWESFKLEVHQHKSKQSRQKGESLANYLIEKSQQIFYQDKRIEIEDFIKRELIQNENLVKNLDDILIIKAQKIELINEMNYQEQVVEYLTNQLNFIQTYVEKYIKHITQQIQQKYQEQFNQELAIIINRIEMNAKQLLENLSNQPNIVNYFEKSIKQKFYEIKDQNQKKEQENLLEIKLFNLVFQYLLEYEQNEKEIEEIDVQYKDCFIHCQKRKQNILINLRNPMDNQINEIQPFLQSLLDTLKLVGSINFNLTQFLIQESLNSLKQAMIGCTHCCPMCNRKCDSEPEFIPHSCQNGHYLRGMQGILLGNKPSLQSCEEIKEDQIIDILETQMQMKWKEMKKIYQKWNFTSLNTKEIKEKKLKWIKIWNDGIGNLICKQLSQNLNTNIDFNKKEKQKIFYIFILDDSFSMEGKKGDNMMTSLKEQLKFLKSNKYAKVSIISFNYKASLQIEFKKPKTKLIKQITLVGGITNFDPPLKLCLDQIKKFEKNVDQTKILLYSDGEGSYSQKSLAEYISLSQELRNKISFMICTAGSKPQILLKMIEHLSLAFNKVELKKNIQSQDLCKCWNETLNKTCQMTMNE